MSYFKLTIEGQVADIGDISQFNSKFNRTVTDIQNISESNGDFSLTLRLPKSDTNNIIFSHSQRMETIDKFVRDENYNARVETYGNNASDWLLKLQSITDDFYEIVMIGKNISWVELLGTKTLPELKNFDSTSWTFPFIGASGSTTPYSHAWHVENDTYNTSDVAWPVVPRGHFFNTANTNVDFFFHNSCSFSDLPPSPYELKIVKKIFENIGWSVDGDVFTNPEHQKIVVPFTSGDYYKWNYGFLYPASGYTNTTLKADYPITGNGHSNWSTQHEIGTTSVRNIMGIYRLNPDIETDTNNLLTPYTFNDLGNNSQTSQAYRIPATGLIDIDFHMKFHSGDTIIGTSTSTLPSSTYRGLARGGFVLYIYTNDADEQVIFENIGDYLYSPSASASVTNPLVIYYYDAFQSSIYGTPTAFQPYNNNADISVVDTTVNNFFLFGLALYILYIEEGSIDVSIRNLQVGGGEEIRCAWVGFGNTYSTAPPQNQTGADTLNSTLSYDEVSWAFRAPSGSTEGTGVDIAANLPAISNLDFIRSWVAKSKLFLSFSDQEKTVRFDTFDNFYLPQDFAYDITTKVDPNYGEPATKPMDLPKNMFFKYSNDSGDVLINQDLDYANLQCSSTNIYTNGDQTVNLLYSATRTRNYTFIPSAVTVNLPMIATEQDTSIGNTTEVQWNFNAGTPRILKTDEYLTDLTGGTVYWEVDGYLEKIMLSRFDDDREGKLSLKWDGDNGLYRNYYDRYLNQIEQSHILSLNTNINAYDFNMLQPNVPVKFQGQHYFLNKIQGFDPNNNAAIAKIELIKKFTN